MSEKRVDLLDLNPEKLQDLGKFFGLDNSFPNSFKHPFGERETRIREMEDRKHVNKEIDRSKESDWRGIDKNLIFTAAKVLGIYTGKSHRNSFSFEKSPDVLDRDKKVTVVFGKGKELFDRTLVFSAQDGQLSAHLAETSKEIKKTPSYLNLSKKDLLALEKAIEFSTGMSGFSIGYHQGNDSLGSSWIMRKQLIKKNISKDRDIVELKNLEKVVPVVLKAVEDHAQQLVNSLSDGSYKFDTEKDELLFIHCMDIAQDKAVEIIKHKISQGEFLLDDIDDFECIFDKNQIKIRILISDSKNKFTKALGHKTQKTITCEWKSQEIVKLLDKILKIEKLDMKKGDSYADLHITDSVNLQFPVFALENELPIKH